VILLVLESHGPLHFCGVVDKGSQRIARQRVVIAARVHVLKTAGFVIAALGIEAGEDEALDFIAAFNV